MLPRGIHSQLYAFALSAAAVISHKDTPKLLRQKISDFIQDLRKELPAEAQAEIEAAEAEATIKAADYLRRDDEGS
jgi:hypothetical protein